MTPNWHFLRQAAMMVPADKMANPLQHTGLSDAELLMREAIQNSADERKSDADGPVRFSVRRKQYRGDEKYALIEKFGLAGLANRAKSFPAAHGWFKFNETCLYYLDDPEVPISAVLLSDHNTNGLGGNWRTSDGVNSRFYNLVLSIYASHKQEGDDGLLGSYGVGKMVYAVTSKIRMMAYYSCFEPSESTEGASARFMATAFLPGHRKDGLDYTGHAFFGNSSETKDYPAKPLTDTEAHEFAEKIGLEKRLPHDTGLTVMLLDCHLDPNECRDACEKFWWPRMFDQHSESYIKLEFSDGSAKIQSPRPRSRSELKPFIDCFSNIRQGVKPDGYESKEINLQAHGKVGNLCLRALENIDEEQNELTNTVALIRGGLVIQYNSEYAREDDPNAVGVFDVFGKYPEKCFTLSEPEAHDEWNYNIARLKRSLGDKAAKLVRLTHSRIKENFRDYQTRQKKVVRKNASEGLEFLDSMLGSIFKRKKKGPPPQPKAIRRAFTIQKNGWRDLKSEPIFDHLDFRIAMAEGASSKPLLCRLKVTLRVLEDAEARAGTIVSCTIVDENDSLMSSGTGTFEFELPPISSVRFRASAQVHSTWRTRWDIAVSKESKRTSGDLVT